MQEAKAEEIPSDAQIKQLPVEILNRRKIKIGGKIYTLDRDIEEDDSRSAKKVKTEDKKEQEYFLEIKWYRHEDSDDGSWKETPYSMFADDIMKFEESRIFSEKEGAARDG